MERRRGKEEQRLTLQEIRRLRLNYFTDKEIQKHLNMADRTWYKYKAMMLEENKELIKERSKELLNEEIQMAKDRLYAIANNLRGIYAKAKEDSIKIDALTQERQTVNDILGIEYESETILGTRNGSNQSESSSQGHKDRELVKP